MNENHIQGIILSASSKIQNVDELQFQLYVLAALCVIIGGVIFFGARMGDVK